MAGLIYISPNIRSNSIYIMKPPIVPLEITEEDLTPITEEDLTPIIE